MKEIKNILLDIKEKIDEMHRIVIREDDKRIVERIKDIVEKQGYIDWSKIRDDEFLSKALPYNTKFHRLMVRILPENKWKGMRISGNYIYYKKGFDPEKIKTMIHSRRIKSEDPELMRMLKMYCDESNGRNVNLDAFLRKHFPHFGDRQRNDVIDRFRLLCRQNKEWKLVPGKALDFVEKEAVHEHENC